MFLIPGTNTILPAVQVSSAKTKAENAWKGGNKEFVSGRRRSCTQPMPVGAKPGTPEESATTDHFRVNAHSSKRRGGRTKDLRNHK
jgi:hypothetical protein